MVDVLIVGGGVIGMLTARELLQQGVKVTLLDKSDFGTEASWAGGGIVSPLYPWTYSEPVTALATWAQAFYPELAQSLLQQTGIDPQLNPCGLLMLDPPYQGQALAWAASNNKPMQCLDGNAVAKQEPNISALFNQALWLPYVSNIRNPRLLQALKASLSAHSDCRLLDHTQVQSITDTSNGAVVATSNAEFRADKVVICTGAWTQKILANTHLQLPVVPVRGQMLIFEPRPHLINSIILSQGKYLIPRLDGRILIGSTLEHDGFNKHTTDQAKGDLLNHAYGMVAALQDVPVEAHWAGLRPGAPAGVPYIGKIPGWNNVYVNAGHFRNGLVLAPASARLMRNLLLNEAPIVNPDPYNPETQRTSIQMH